MLNVRRSAVRPRGGAGLCTAGIRLDELDANGQEYRHDNDGVSPVEHEIFKVTLRPAMDVVARVVAVRRARGERWGHLRRPLRRRWGQRPRRRAFEERIDRLTSEKRTLKGIKRTAHAIYEEYYSDDFANY